MATYSSDRVTQLTNENPVWMPDQFKDFYEVLCQGLAADSTETLRTVSQLWRRLDISEQIYTLLDNPKKSKSVRDGLTKDNKIQINKIEQRCNPEFAKVTCILSDILDTNEQVAAQLINYSQRNSRQYFGGSLLRIAVESWHDERDYLLESLILMITYFITPDELKSLAESAAVRGKKAVENVLTSTTSGFVAFNLENVITSTRSLCVPHILDTISSLEDTIINTKSLLNNKLDDYSDQDQKSKRTSYETSILEDQIEALQIHLSRITHQRASLATTLFYISSRFGLSNDELKLLINNIAEFKYIDSARTIIFSSYLLIVNSVFSKGLLESTVYKTGVEKNGYVPSDQNIILRLPESRFLLNTISSWDNFYSLINSGEWKIPELKSVVITQLVSLMSAIANVYESSGFDNKRNVDYINAIPEEEEIINDENKFYRIKRTFSNEVLHKIYLQCESATEAWRSKSGSQASTYLFIAKYLIPTDGTFTKEFILEQFKLNIPNLNVESRIQTTPENLRNSIIHIFELLIDNVIIYLQPYLKDIQKIDQDYTFAVSSSEPQIVQQNVGSFDDYDYRYGFNSNNANSGFYPSLHDDSYFDYSRNKQSRQMNISNQRTANPTNNNPGSLSTTSSLENRDITSWESLLYLITILYMDRPDAASNYWKMSINMDLDALIVPINSDMNSYYGEQPLKVAKKSIETLYMNQMKERSNFLELASDVIAPRFIVAFLNMLASLSTGKNSAEEAHARLNVDKSQARFGRVTWSVLFGSLKSYSNLLNNSNLELTDEEEALIVAFLRVLRQIVKFSFTSKRLLTDSSDFDALHVLFSFFASSIRVTLKAAVLDTITAFCIAPKQSKKYSSVLLDPRTHNEDGSKGSLSQRQRDEKVISRGIVLENFLADEVSPELLQNAYDIQCMVWQYLEECQALPTKTLAATDRSNYRSEKILNFSNSNNLLRSSNSSINKGLLEDLLTIEALDRTYPQTRALVKLLVALTSVDKNSKTSSIFEYLGNGYRLPGIRVYIKFVIDEVFVKIDQFKFKRIEEKHELISYCMHLFKNCVNLFDLAPFVEAAALNEKRNNDTHQNDNRHDNRKTDSAFVNAQQKNFFNLAFNLALEPGFEIITSVLNNNKFMEKLLSLINNGVELLYVDRDPTDGTLNDFQRTSNSNSNELNKSDNSKINRISSEQNSNIKLTRSSPSYIYRNETIRLALNVLLKVFTNQKIFLEILCPAIVDSNMVETVRLPTPMYGLDSVLAYNKNAVISIIKYVSSHNDDISLNAVRLFSILSTCTPFSNVGSSSVGLNQTRKLVSLIQAEKDETLLQGFVERLAMEEDEYLPNEILERQLNYNNPFENFQTEKRNDALLLSESSEISMVHIPQAGDIHQIRMSILKLILTNLHPLSPLMTVAHMILGFKLGDYLASSTFGSTEEINTIGCLHVILGHLRRGMHNPSDLISSDKSYDSNLQQTKLQYSHPQFAEQCYQILYRLCENQYTSSQIMNYLRHNEDFFYIQAYNMPTFDMENSTRGEIRQLGDAPIHSEIILSNLKQRSWLLKLITLELHVTASSRSTHAERLVSLFFLQESAYSILDEERRNKKLLESSSNRRRIMDHKKLDSTKSNNVNSSFAFGLDYDKDDQYYDSFDGNAYPSNDSYFFNDEDELSGSDYEIEEMREANVDDATQLFDEDEQFERSYKANNELKYVLEYSSRKSKAFKNRDAYINNNTPSTNKAAGLVTADKKKASEYIVKKREHKSRKFIDQPLSKILELLASLDFKEEDLDIDFNVRSDIFSNLNINDFWLYERYDLPSIASFLQKEINKLPLDARPRATNERKRILETLLAINVYRELIIARRQCAVSWGNLVRIMLSKCYDLLLTDVSKERVLFDISSALIKKLNTSSISPNRLELNIAEDMSVIIFLLITKVQTEYEKQYQKQIQEARTAAIASNKEVMSEVEQNAAIKFAEDSIAKRPSGITDSSQIEVLSGLLTALDSQVLTLAIRGNLYSSIIAFLRFTSPDEIASDGKFSKINIEDWLSTILANYDTINSHIPVLLDVLFRDSVAGLSIWNIVPFTLLDHLYKLYQWHSILNGTPSNDLLVALSQKNALDNFVRALQRVASVPYEDLLSSDVDTQGMELMFGCLSSFFLRIAINQKGSHALLERNIIETVSEFDFLDHRPDITRYFRTMSIEYEKAQHLYGLVHRYKNGDRTANTELNNLLTKSRNEGNLERITFIKEILGGIDGFDILGRSNNSLINVGLDGFGYFSSDVRKALDEYLRYRTLALPIFRLIQLISRQGPSVYDIPSRIERFIQKHDYVLKTIIRDSIAETSIPHIQELIREEAAIVKSFVHPE